MSAVEHLAAFVTRARFEQLSPEAVIALKVRVLDSLGCALGALGGPPLRAIRQYLGELGGRETVTLVGGGRTSPDRAALYNGALVRWLDFNDSFLAPGETCHPSDNLAPVLAAIEHGGGSGRDLLVALAVAYQVQCRLSEVAPVRARGFDHTTQGSYAVAAGVCRALGLDPKATADAIAIAGTSGNALRVTRTGALSNWKGLAYPHAAACAMQAAFLAKAGITGPAEVFEGTSGFMDAIAGRFEIDWEAESLEKVCDTSLKRFNAEFHAQSAIEALLELRAENDLRPEAVERIELSVFQVAKDIIGGGAEGAKTEVRTKEEADHSLPYMAAVAILDGQLMPEQYAPERISRADVQSLLRRVDVTADEALTRAFPKAHGCRARLRLNDGRVLERSKSDFEGFHTRPMPWERVVEKFERLARPSVSAGRRKAILEVVNRLERVPVAELCIELSRARD